MYVANVAWLAGTVMFLGKAVLLSTIILLLVQFIANTETCYLHTGVDKLPSHFQKILLDKYKTNSLRCPYSKIENAFSG